MKMKTINKIKTKKTNTNKINEKPPPKKTKNKKRNNNKAKQTQVCNKKRARF